MGKTHVFLNIDPLVYSYMFQMNTPIDRLYYKWKAPEFEEKTGMNVQDLIAEVDGACNNHRHTTINIIDLVMEEIDG